MTLKVQKAVDNLNKILPLSERQKKLSPEIANIYQKILHSYVNLGRTLNKSEISGYAINVDEVIDVLRSNDMVVFDTNNEPVGAYPFTMEQRDHKVKVNGHAIHSMCALDALAISPMFQIAAQIDSICHVTGESIEIDQRGLDILNKDAAEEVNFGINWNSATNNCCATSLCTEMIFLKNSEIANEWYSKDMENRQIFNLNEAIEFASGFFVPLIRGEGHR